MSELGDSKMERGKFDAVNSLEELYGILDVIGMIQGDKKEEDGRDIVNSIKREKAYLIHDLSCIDAMEGDFYIQQIPLTDGLRGKVIDLLRKAVSELTEEKVESEQDILKHNVKMLQVDMQDLLMGESVEGERW